MRKVHLGMSTSFIVVSFLILMSYQNCSVPKSKSTPDNNPNQTSALANENIQSVKFLSSENTVVQQNSKTFTLVSQTTYSVDYLTGEIIKNIQANSDKQQFCLSESLLTELHDIIESSSVCKTENVASKDQVCSQVYKYGYAQIITNKETIDLGSGSDGCTSDKIDLCEQASTNMLRGWFQAVKNQLTHLSCPKAN